MSRKYQMLLIVGCLVMSATATFAQAGPAAKPPMPPMSPSPVEMFRMLMFTNAAGREQFLASKSPAARAIIEAKLREYEEMTLQQREERLRSLQLGWYALQLMGLKPADRAAQLANLPETDRTNVLRRLGRVDILPPLLKQEILTNDLVKRALVQGNPDASRNVVREMSEEERKREVRKQELLGHFKEFFYLRPAEQNKTLSRLTVTEREKMEKTLSTFGSLSKADREQAIEGFKKFADLSDTERAEFLKTAGRWQTMSEKDRQLWRAIVTSLERAKSNPPRPMPFTATSPQPSTLVATNY
jgi:hypothetical protein